jgi:uncharacterized protein YqeY
MSLKEQLQADLKDALRARDERRKAVIRMALADITMAEVERRAELDDADVVAVLRKQADRRRETIAELRQANRPDLLANEEHELALLEAYLPQMLSREEIAAEARQVIAEVLSANPSGAAGPKLLGQVMRPLMQRLKGRADGTIVNEVVRELLAA